MGGLVLTRKFGEAVVIGGDVTVRVLPADAGGKVRLHIDAPRETLILREEICSNREAAPLARLVADHEVPTVDVPEFEWVSWWTFVRERMALLRPTSPVGLIVRRDSVLGVVMGWQTFPDTDDPELVVAWDGQDQGEARASQVEWKVSA